MAINFSMYDKAVMNNLSIKRINYFFLKQMKQNFTTESFYSFLLLCGFMSEKAANKIETDAGYLITNAYKKAIEFYYGKAVNAIVYSSAMSENNGLNIAISKDLIDNGDIEFHGASVYKIKSHPYKHSKALFPCSNYAKPDSYGNFKLKFHNIDYLFG